MTENTMTHRAEDCGCPTHAPPKTMNRRRYLGLTALTTLAVGGYLAGPAAWQWNRAAEHAARRGQVLEQVDTVAGPVDPALIARLRATTTSPQAAPIILTYHDIGPQTNSIYTVHPEAFAAQMRLLHDAGWTTLTAAQVDAWHRGEPVPDRSVLITFDDGCMGVWQYAEPLLRRYGMHASAFIITGFVGTHEPYYMHWDHIQDLHKTGRWDVLAHTHLGHVYVQGDEHGGTGPFPHHAPVPTGPAAGGDASGIPWPGNPGSHRVQASARPPRLPEPRFFAYPFSAHEADVAQATVLSLYGGGGMLDDAELIQVTSAADVAMGLIRRMDVTGKVGL